MLGAGIRLGEAIVGSDVPPGRARESDGNLAVRLGELEDRLQNLEPGKNTGSTAYRDSSHGSRIEMQAAEAAAIRSQLNRDDRELEALSEIGLRLRSELHGWLEESVTARMADVESKLKSESERSQRQMLDAFVDGVQTRVMQRISRLEEEVGGQSAAMTELRECSLRTEQSMQKLLGGLDRLIIPQPVPAAAALSRWNATLAKEADLEPRTPQPLEEPKMPDGTLSRQAEPPRPKSRRWSIFG